MTPILQTQGLSKRYRQRWALTDCTLTIPAGHVVGLVGPNGAGKTTLLHLATGLLSPTAGTIEVLGRPPASKPEQLARIGFVAQDAPTYAGMSVADHLRLGARMNPGWTRPWPPTGSSGWAWTPGSGPASCPAASGPSSP
jgi:ABC-2 type transport system ATP-binding protein